MVRARETAGRRHALASLSHLRESTIARTATRRTTKAVTCNVVSGTVSQTDPVDEPLMVSYHLTRACLAKHHVITAGDRPKWEPRAVYRAIWCGETATVLWAGRQAGVVVYAPAHTTATFALVQMHIGSNCWHRVGQPHRYRSRPTGSVEPRGEQTSERGGTCLSAGRAMGTRGQRRRHAPRCTAAAGGCSWARLGSWGSRDQPCSCSAAAACWQSEHPAQLPCRGVAHW